MTGSGLLRRAANLAARPSRGGGGLLFVAVAVLLLGGCGGEPAATPTPDDVLVVVTATPGPERRSATPERAAATYVVREGDSLSVIADRFGVSEAAILEANALDDPNRVMVGEALLIPPAEP